MSVRSVSTADLQIYNVIGIGSEPANITLPITLKELGFARNRLFLGRPESTKWQPEMMPAGSDIQEHPSRDLVTPRNPRSRYTVLDAMQQMAGHATLSTVANDADTLEFINGVAHVGE